MTDPCPHDPFACALAAARQVADRLPPGLALTLLEACRHLAEEHYLLEARYWHLQREYQDFTHAAAPVLERARAAQEAALALWRDELPLTASLTVLPEKGLQSAAEPTSWQGWLRSTVTGQWRLVCSARSRKECRQLLRERFRADQRAAGWADWKVLRKGVLP
jgi:hypothetical protein